MLKLIMIAAVALTSPAFAGQNCYEMGNQYICNGNGSDSGYNSNSYQLGNQTIINQQYDGQTHTTSCYQMGNQMICN